MKLNELFNTDTLDKYIHDGYVNVQRHPSLPLLIFNYSDKCMWENVWDEVTTRTRGLIVDEETQEIVASGPAKFFNYGQPGEPKVSLDTPVDVTTKWDGSLIIQAHYKGQIVLASRGSFTSDQAKWAAEIGAPLELDDFDPDEHTLIYELLVPENKIVCDYGDRRELVPLGLVDNRTGLIVERFTTQGGDTLGNVLQWPIPDDEEGYVLDILDSEGNTVDHLKLKGEHYKYLHKLASHLSPLHVWENMVAWTVRQIGSAKGNLKGFDKSLLDTLPVSDSVIGMFEGIPDEFADWLHETVANLSDAEGRLTNSDIFEASRLSEIPEGRERFEACTRKEKFGSINRYIKNQNVLELMLNNLLDIRPSGNRLVEGY